MRKAGVEVIETATVEASAHAIAAAMRQSKKPEHTTLRRYLRPHIPPFDVNAHVDNLARLTHFPKGSGVGVEQAKKLVERFGTFWKVMAAEFDDLADVVGPTRAENFWKTVGREE